MFVSRQANALAICYFVAFISVAVMAFKSLPFVYAIQSIVPFIIMVALVLYDTDCLVTGGCNMYAWVRTLLYIIGILVSLNLLSFTFLQSLKKPQNTPTSLPQVTLPTQQQPTKDAPPPTKQ